jgi:hypothetical protein
VNRTRALLNRPVTVVDGYFDVMGVDRGAQTTAQRRLDAIMHTKPRVKS